MIRTVLYPEASSWAEYVQRPVQKNTAIEPVIQQIFDQVKKEGDAGLKKITARLDKAELLGIAVKAAEITQAAAVVSLDLQKAIQIAATNIRKFHEAQLEPVVKVETMAEVTCWRKSVPINRVGLYIPGGSAPLFSTLLMLGIPAQVAGCPEIILCTPPDKSGNVHPAILYTAELLGITKIYKIGGAQAVAAMAFGTESIAPVNKIFGPGNQYVTVAKQMVSKEGIAIDMPAGPSEVLVLADEEADPEFVAADLLAQAEHGPDSQVVVITNSEALLQKVNAAIIRQIEDLPRKEIVELALTHSLGIVLEDVAQMLAFSNLYAPEHLIIATQKAAELAEAVTNAGSVFIGNYTPESCGDYASGTNHTLPTNAYARAYSGVSLDSFFKKITFQHITATGLKNIGATVEIMAAAEGLQAHKNAVSIRLSKIG